MGKAPVNNKVILAVVKRFDLLQKPFNTNPDCVVLYEISRPNGLSGMFSTTLAASRKDEHRRIKNE